MENSLSSVIETASSILILLPQKPYFDQVAAGLSLYLSLMGKKEVGISCPTPMVVEFNRLVGVNKISSDVASKNLALKFVDYKANDIERVSYDIEDGEFKLTIIPKPGMKSPKKEQVVFSYSGIAADLVILIGGGNETHFPQLASPDLANAKLIHIGIRALSVPGKTIMSFARPASSISELSASLIKESGMSIDADSATNLLMGIEEGSRDFKGQDVTAETFQTVSDLMRAGGRRVSKMGDRPQGTISEVVSPVEKVELAPQEAKKEEPEAPKDWLEPKIYKGTSIS